MAEYGFVPNTEFTPEKEARLRELEARANPPVTEENPGGLTPEELARLRELEARAAADQEEELQNQGKEFDKWVKDEPAPESLFIGSVPKLDSIRARFGAKNWGTDTPETLNEVQRMMGDTGLKAFRHPVKGTIYYKSPETGRLHPMDPSGFDAQDLTDVTFDMPSGLVQGLATGTMAGLGALGGGALGTAMGGPGVGAVGAGIGGLGAASATSATTNAASEALRQKVGQWLGYNPPELQMGDIKNAAGVGAMTPLIFGGGASGKALKGLAQESLLKQGKPLTQEAVAQLQQTLEQRLMG